MLAVTRVSEARVELFDTRSGGGLGFLQLASDRGAFYQAASGNLEVFGDGAGKLGCLLAPRAQPFTVCQDRYLETGLLARSLLGHGCAVEDVGNLCD